MHLQDYNSLFAKDEPEWVCLQHVLMLLTIAPIFPCVKINVLVIQLFVVVVFTMHLLNLQLSHKETSWP